MFPVVYREHSYPPLVQLDRISDSDSDDVGSIPVGRANKKVSFVYQTKETFLSDAFLTERDAHFARDADFVCDARLRRVSGTHRITYHSKATSLITYIQ